MQSTRDGMGPRNESMKGRVQMASGLGHRRPPESETVNADSKHGEYKKKTWGSQDTYKGSTYRVIRLRRGYIGGSIDWTRFQ